MRVLFAMLLLASVCLCQSVEEGWRGIKPLATTRNEAETILGKPEIDKNGYHRFRTEEAFVTINYSTEPCLPNQYNRGQYNVPEGIVLRYWVSFNNAFASPPEIVFDRKTYFRDTTGDAGTIRYYDGKSGVIISAEEMQGKEFITGLEYQPSKSARKKFGCAEKGFPK